MSTTQGAGLGGQEGGDYGGGRETREEEEEEKGGGGELWLSCSLWSLPF